MTTKNIHLTVAATVIFITIGGCIVSLIFFPPAAAIVAVSGSAIVKWFVDQALEVVEEAIEEDLPTETLATRESSAESSEGSLEQHVHTIHLHYSERDIEGNHRSEDIRRETIIENEPPPRPPSRKPGF
jgi:hypothetical protein